MHHLTIIMSSSYKSYHNDNLYRHQQYDHLQLSTWYLHSSIPYAYGY